MATENRAKFIIDLVGNVSQRARSFGASIRQLGDSGSMSMRVLSRSVSGVNGILDKFDNKLVGFATGGGLVMAGKRVGEQSQLLTELGTRYNLTADQVNGFNQAVWANSANRKIGYSELITATDKFLERTNDIDGAVTQMDNIALAMKGIGLNAEDAGELVSAFWLSGVKDAKAMTKALDGLSSVSLMGTGNLSDQVKSVPGIIKNSSWKKPEDVAQIVGMQRLSSSVFNDPSQAAGAMDGFYEGVKKEESQRILKINGIDVFADKKMGVYKSPAELMREIGIKAKGKEGNFKTVFDNGDTVKLAVALSEKENQRKLKELSNPTNIKDGFTDEKASKNVQTLNGAITSLTNAGEKFAQLKLAKPVQDLADAINSLSPEELDKYTGVLEKATYAIGAAVAARYGHRLFKWGKGIFKPGSAGAGAGGGDGPLGAQNVFVTNWPVGGLAGGNNVVGGGKGAMGMLGKVGMAGMATAMVTPVVEGGLDMAFGDNQYHANLKYAQTWSDFAGAIFGRDTVKKGANGQWQLLTDEERAANANTPQPQATPSPYLQGGTLGEQWNRSQAAAPTEPRDFRQAIQPPDGKITVEVSSKDSDLNIKTKEVKSRGVDLRVNTGYTYGGGM